MQEGGSPKARVWAPTVDPSPLGLLPVSWALKPGGARGPHLYVRPEVNPAAKRPLTSSQRNPQAGRAAACFNSKSAAQAAGAGAEGAAPRHTSEGRPRAGSARRRSPSWSLTAGLPILPRPPRSGQVGRVPGACHQCPASWPFATPPPPAPHDQADGWGAAGQDAFPLGREGIPGRAHCRVIAGRPSTTPKVGSQGRGRDSCPHRQPSSLLPTGFRGVDPAGLSGRRPLPCPGTGEGGLAGRGVHSEWVLILALETSDTGCHETPACETEVVLLRAGWATCCGRASGLEPGAPRGPARRARAWRRVRCRVAGGRHQSCRRQCRRRRTRPRSRAWRPSRASTMGLVPAQYRPSARASRAHRDSRSSREPPWGRGRLGAGGRRGRGEPQPAGRPPRRTRGPASLWGGWGAAGRAGPPRWLALWLCPSVPVGCGGPPSVPGASGRVSKVAGVGPHRAPAGGGARAQTYPWCWRRCWRRWGRRCRRRAPCGRCLGRRTEWARQRAPGLAEPWVAASRGAGHRASDAVLTLGPTLGPRECRERM